jgi:WD40 repeat protein
LKVWNPQTGALQRQWMGHEGGVHAVAAAPGGLLASGGKDRRVKLWDARTGALLREFAGHGDVVTGVVFSPDGTRVVSGSTDGTARVFEVATGRELVVFRGHNSKIHQVAFSPDGTRVASASGDRERQKAPCDVRIWDAETGEERVVLSDGSVVFCAWRSLPTARVW